MTCACANLFSEVVFIFYPANDFFTEGLSRTQTSHKGTKPRINPSWCFSSIATKLIIYSAVRHETAILVFLLVVESPTKYRQQRAPELQALPRSFSDTSQSLSAYGMEL